jgi:hypothetical protein
MLTLNNIQLNTGRVFMICLLDLSLNKSVIKFLFKKIELCWLHQQQQQSDQITPITYLPICVKIGTPTTHRLSIST